jgi:hypothetical protein
VFDPVEPIASSPAAIVALDSIWGTGVDTVRRREEGDPVILADDVEPIRITFRRRTEAPPSDSSLGGASFVAPSALA